MIAKTINYTDFMGTERTEELHFNLTQTELVELSMDLPDGLVESVNAENGEVDPNTVGMKILEALGGKGVFEFIKKLLLKSYGRIAEDGRRFEKSEKLSEEFSQTIAYDTIVMELMSDEEAAANFVNNVLSASANKKIAALPTQK